MENDHKPVWRKWTVWAILVGLGALTIYITVDLIIRGLWWVILILVIGYGLLFLFAELFLILYSITTIIFLFVMAFKHEMTYVWIFLFSLGGFIFFFLLYQLKKLLGFSDGIDIPYISGLFNSMKDGASKAMQGEKQKTVRDKYGDVIGAVDKKMDWITGRKDIKSKAGKKVGEVKETWDMWGKEEIYDDKGKRIGSAGPSLRDERGIKTDTEKKRHDPLG